MQNFKGSEGVPSMYDALLQTTQMVPNPNSNERLNGRTTVYDSWSYYSSK